MKILWAARLARFDLLRAVCHLAQNVTKWTTDCDRKLLRLVGYIQYSKGYRLMGWVGDKLEQCQPHLYADADFAGCSETQRSTSGLHFVCQGPRTNFPLTGISKRQGCVSHSTPEAEIVATAFALRMVGLPALQLWHTILPQRPTILIHEDNQAMLRVIETGKNPTMRYLHRTHRVNVSWLHERFKGKKDLDIVYEK